MAREKARREWNWEHLFEASRRVYSRVTLLQGGLFQNYTLYMDLSSCTFKVDQDLHWKHFSVDLEPEQNKTSS